MPSQTTTAELIEREQRVLYPIYRRIPIAIARAEGCWIEDVEGRRYLDMISGIGVNALGHGHRRIIEAITGQANRYLHVSNLFYQEPQILLAERLCQRTGYAAVVYANSGAEAWEAALKLVRRWGHLHGKHGKVLTFTGGFHGRTYGALSGMEKPLYKDGMGPFLPQMQVLPYNDPDALEAAADATTVAVGLEFLQGEGGIVEAQPAFIERLAALRKRYGFLVIADEVQSGCGRTGDFFAFERYGFRPDIVTMAKAIGGGLPLGAVLVAEHLLGVWQRGQHGTTFGGNPLACAAGLAVLDALDEGVFEHVRTMGALIRHRLERVASTFPTLVRSVRGRGLMAGLELSEDASAVRDGLLERGVIANATATTVLRLLPPLIITAEEWAFAEEALSAVLAERAMAQAVAATTPS
ncbi:MAG: acetylornithine aminotransferase [Candidatus Kapaibacterium sp.]|nr:MAG: acetylornithine aminotransferase [Candidatus Kapabacteria bacterium]